MEKKRNENQIESPGGEDYRKERTKKCISWITVAALLGGITSPFNSGAASVEAADIPEPLVKFDFEDLSENAESLTKMQRLPENIRWQKVIKVEVKRSL